MGDWCLYNVKYPIYYVPIKKQCGAGNPYLRHTGLS